ncbi:hypothetical protein KXX32_005110 [Aspergillus fumigatus]|nr:hypothetical protein KXX32_005110 [Aspergillus fumigatus]
MKPDPFLFISSLGDCLHTLRILLGPKDETVISLGRKFKLNSGYEIPVLSARHDVEDVVATALRVAAWDTGISTVLLSA